MADVEALGAVVVELLRHADYRLDASERLVGVTVVAHAARPCPTHPGEEEVGTQSLVIDLNDEPLADGLQLVSAIDALIGFLERTEPAPCSHVNRAERRRQERIRRRG